MLPTPRKKDKRVPAINNVLHCAKVGPFPE